MRPRIASGAIAVALMSAFVPLGASVALADAPVDSGWWTVANPGPPAPAASPPDVPADGLLVQGGPTEPVAIAGLIYEPPAGAVPMRLVLRVSAGSATTPGAVLQLCPLTGLALNAQQGGPMANAPTYDCSRKVSAAPAADGASYTFNLGGLGTVGPLAVALLPTAPSDRVAFAKPGADSLVTSAPTPGFSPAPFRPEPQPEPEFLNSDPGPQAPVVEPSFFGARELPVVGLTGTAAPQQPPTVAANPAAAQPWGSVVTTTAVGSASSDQQGAVGALLLALLATGCGLWAFAGRAHTVGNPTV